jgi:hypothetical protein
MVEHLPSNHKTRSSNPSIDKKKKKKKGKYSANFLPVSMLYHHPKSNVRSHLTPA